MLQVTEFGVPLVKVTRIGKSRVKMPDFAANLKNAGASQAVGDRIMRGFYDSFEPRSRAMAQRAGLKLLPAQA